MAGDVEDFSITLKRSLKSANPVVILSVPDTGLVGSIAASQIIHELAAEEVGSIESDLIPPVVIVRDGEPKTPVMIHQKDDIVTVTSEIPLPSITIYPFARAIVKWAKQNNARVLLGVTGLPISNRLEVESPAVFGLATTQAYRVQLNSADIEVFREGIITGPYAVFIKEAEREEVPAVTLLAEAHLQFPDPGASAAAVKAVNRFLNLNVKVDSLLEKAEDIRIRARDLMRRTQEQMRMQQKAREQELPGIYV